MSDQEEKRIIVKVAYNYFQDGKWDLALSEYQKLTLIDPMDFLVHNMMAEIYLRKGDSDQAVVEYAKAASLLYATNNVDKAIQAYNQILKHKPRHVEANEKIVELVAVKLLSIDKLINEGDLERAFDQCNKLSFKISDDPKINQKLEEIEKRLEEKQSPTLPSGTTRNGAQGDKNQEETDRQTNEELVENLMNMGERYEEKESWDEAIETYLTILRFKPDDNRIKVKLNNLYRLITRPTEPDVQSTTQPLVHPIEVPIEQIMDNEQKLNKDAEEQAGIKNDESKNKKVLPKANLSSTFEEMEDLRQQAEARLRQAVQDRRTREALSAGEVVEPPVHVSSTDSPPLINENKDIQALLTQVQMYINQNMLVEALRICQRLLEHDATNRDVRQLLKKIYDKKKFN